MNVPIPYPSKCLLLDGPSDEELRKQAIIFLLNEIKKEDDAAIAVGIRTNEQRRVTPRTDSDLDEDNIFDINNYRNSKGLK